MEKRKHKVEVRYAESLSQVYGQIASIVGGIKGEDTQERPLLWFRGHLNTKFNLEPSIFRGAEYLFNEDKTYSNNHLREEYRFQSFMSRNFDNVTERLPQSMIEWQEIMQHFFTKTRLMDWSESLTVALEFALEAFITPEKNLEVEERRRTLTPAIWILRPDALNMEVYDSFWKKGTDLIQKVLDDSPQKDMLAEKLQKELEGNKKIYVHLENKNERNMNGLVSLSSLEYTRNTYSGRMEQALEKLEVNPFFYLLLRYYSDGIPVGLGELPPLAIIHPYHSQRIKMQRGVFTVFPYYIPDEKTRKLAALSGTYPLSMEYMETCIPLLYKIQIINPQRVADELIVTGAKRGSLYPDMENISKDIENVV
jgi:hypothetical protein